MSFQVQYVTYNLLYQLNDDDDDDKDDHLPTLFYFRMAKKTYGVNTLTLTKSCLLASP